jgi:hypothetical protein
MFRLNDKSIALGFLLGLALLYLGVLSHGPSVARDVHALSSGIAISQSQPLKTQVPAEIYASPEGFGGLPNSAAIRDTRKVLFQGFSIVLPAAFAPKVSSYILNSVFNI